MNPNAEEMELRERLDLMQKMIAEGRRKQESWGWTYVLWGIAYYVAFFWGWLGKFPYAWPITMTAAAILTFRGFTRPSHRSPETTIGRAIASIWIATGGSMFILFDAMGFGLHLADARVFFAAASAMIGLANAACSLTLKWKAEFLCAIVWWAAAVIACFCNLVTTVVAFLTAIFLCQILFGAYMMVLESRQRRQVASHA
ncbi:MAG: hypothetical protein ACLQHF_18605 [Terracidiphilus sp.]